MSKKVINKTKENLRNALVKKLQYKSFDEISITEVCEIAGVSRMSFYRHYANLQDLLNELADDSYSFFFNSLEKSYVSSSTREFLIAYFTDIPKYRKEVTVLYNNRKNLFPFISPDEFDNKDFYYKLCYLYTSLISIDYIWFNSGMKETPEKMAEICTELYGNYKLSDKEMDLLRNLEKQYQTFSEII